MEIARTERFHDILYQVVKETGGLEGFLHTIFYFLQKRTDFYYECDPGDKMGFPPGVNQQIVLNIIGHYQQEHWKKYGKKEYSDYLKKQEQWRQSIQAQQQGAAQKEQSQLKQDNQQSSKSDKKEEQKQEQQQQQKQQQQQQKQQQQQQSNEQQQQQNEQQNKQGYFSTYNGGETSKYKWSQSVTDVTLSMKLPCLSRGKELKVDIGSQSIKVVHNKEGELLQGQLYDLVKSEESIWQIEDQQTLQIVLEKQNENIWKTVLKGDDEIDATKVDNSKKLEDFDWETQGALRKVMYEQERKQKGLPTSEEEKQMEMLKQAWNQEGSPFKGQPFDPSKFNLSQ